MAFKEQIGNLADKKEPDIVDLKLLRSTPMPGAAGMTWGELYDQAAEDNELKHGEDFFSFVKRMKENQGEDQPGKPVKKAA